MTEPANAPITVEARLHEAELRAESLVALLRMAAAVALVLSFFLMAQDPDAGVPKEGTLRRLFALATLAAYFLLGLTTWIANRRGLFRRWMIWVAAFGDCLFLLINLWLSIETSHMPGSRVFLFPQVWLGPMVLAFGVLRFNPYLQGLMVIVVVSGLIALTGYAPDRARLDGGSGLGVLFLSEAPNAIRLTLLSITGVILVIAAALTRSVLRRAIDETRKGMNLTRYLPARLAPRLAQGGLEELQRGVRQPMGILFIDLRGFTHWSENREPEEITSLISEFRERVAVVARQTGGLIDKFIGDAAMILFEGADEPERAAKACIDCAEGLDQSMVEWSRSRQAEGDSAIGAGIGLHWGEVFSGVVGTQERLEYTVFGDTVNTAARLEELTRTTGMGVIASRAILRLAQVDPDRAGWVALPETQVRGRRQSIEILGRPSDLQEPLTGAV